MHQYKGKLIVHTGSMFSGKTSSLWKDLNRFRIARYEVLAFKPAIDVRSEFDRIVSHDNDELFCIAVSSLEEIAEIVKRQPADVIGIDEVQFMDDDPREVARWMNELLERNLTVVAAGLDLDYRGRPFEIVKELMPIADYLTKHHAVCAACGVDAWVSHRKTEDAERVVIGAHQEYEPLCRACYLEKEAGRRAAKNQISFTEMEKEA